MCCLVVFSNDDGEAEPKDKRTQRQRQEDGCKFQASLNYIVSSMHSRLKSEHLCKIRGGGEGREGEEMEGGRELKVQRKGKVPHSRIQLGAWIFCVCIAVN